MVILIVLEEGQGPAVVYVTEYVFNALEISVIVPVLALIVIPAGEALNVPPGVPVIVGVGSVPETQNVEEG